MSNHFQFDCKPLVALVKALLAGTIKEQDKQRTGWNREHLPRIRITPSDTILNMLSAVQQVAYNICTDSTSIALLMRFESFIAEERVKRQEIRRKTM